MVTYLLLGTVLALALALVVDRFKWRSPPLAPPEIVVRVEYGEKKPKPAEKTEDKPMGDAAMKAILRQQAEIANFYNYDGSDQTEATDIAQAAFDQIVAAEPKRGVSNGRK